MHDNHDHTLENFRRLPLLIPLGVVCHWTGYNPKTIARLVEQGRMRAVRPHGGKRRFYKKDLARLCGLEV